MNSVEISGLIEVDGRRLGRAEIEKIVTGCREGIPRFGGEFFLSWDGGRRARDHFGIMPGDCPKGTLMCDGKIAGSVIPDPPLMQLEDAIIAAVNLRSDEGVTALSGGVDSALIAWLAKRECVSVGLAGSHDLGRARHAADTLGLACTGVEITEHEIETALPAVVKAIPVKDVINTGIALPQYFIARWAGEHGYHRILTGQGADELFGGYSRYLKSTTLVADLERDFSLLELQAQRDQLVAALHRTVFSMPYLDIRVVRAARAIPVNEKVTGGHRKVPLRKVAEQYIPGELAWYGKKAMQYGSGVAKVLKKLAKNNGYKNSTQDYIDHISRVEHGH